MTGNSNPPSSRAEGQFDCSHCGLPVPAGLAQPDEEHQFCCNGCRAVFAVIHGCGLERFYRLREGDPGTLQAARTTQRAYAEFDDETFRTLYYRPQPDGTMATEFYLEGVHCAACVWLVEKLPQIAPGVIESRLDMRRAIVEVRWDPQRVKLSRIAATLDSLGYPPHPAKDIRARQMRRAENHRFLIRLGVAAACAGNVMTLAFAIYGGAEAQYAELFRWASMFCGWIALVWPGSLFFRGAWAALRTRTAHLDLPIAIGLAAGGIAGTINTVLGREQTFFDSLAVLVLLLLVGRWLQRRQQFWANDALELLFSLTPTSARRLESGAVVEVPIEAVRPGDLVEVRAGDSIPADGRVVEGESSVNRALLTGESQPAAVSPGSPVAAGTLNISTRLVVEVEAVGEETRVGRLMRLVEEHSRDRPPIVEFADRVAGRFVRIVLAVAAITFLAWLPFSVTSAIDNSVALLIVTCPCALGLATPLAVTIALGRAARRHILVKGGEVFEILSRPGVMYLDKTGTLTAGRIALVSWHGDENLRPLVAALEEHSAHPIARALIACSEEVGRNQRSAVPAADAALTFPAGTAQACSGLRLTATEVQQTIGGGITGIVAGQRLTVGSLKFLRELGCQIPADIDAAVQATIAAAATPVIVAVEGRAVAVACLGDPLRPDAAESVERLRRQGWHVRIVSGDHPEVVAAVGRQLGVAAEDAIGGVAPEEKLAIVQRDEWRSGFDDSPPRKREREKRRKGEHPISPSPDLPVSPSSSAAVMVGDGVNDAAALSAAGVGIAVHGGAEASLAAAHVYLDQPGLAPILELTAAARATMRAIRRCFFASIAYNSLAGALAVTGVISPLIAAILMPISSFTVFALAYSARTFGDRR